MMKIAILSFTKNGSYLNKELQTFLKKDKIEVQGFTIKKFAGELKELTPSLKEWLKNNFENFSAFIFIGAVGIAVRSIAPLIKSKDIDPAVIVLDEKGQFVIPILSGHIGGANELGFKIAKVLKAIPVITTATDINNKFAVDNFALKNNLYIDNIKDIKIISGRILENKKIGLFSDVKIKGKLPENLTLQKEEIGICISPKNIKPFDFTMNLVPKNLTLGIGCRKNKSLMDIEALVFSVIKENNININAIKGIYSIDLKKDEPGIIEFSKKYNLPFKVFSCKELKNIEGNFTKSAFVNSITGVDNVCERAAVLGSDNGEIYVKKTSANGVTVAIAKEEWSVLFE